MKVLYTAFDAYPGYKGAQAHIRSNLRAAKEQGYDATLLCLGGRGSFQDPESSAAVHACAANQQNLLKRSEEFGRFVTMKADSMIDDPPDIIHFRDIWSGMPLLSHNVSLGSRLVYEVNGLPSIELPNRFPRVARNPSLLMRVRAMEDECLDRCHRIITVSGRTAGYLSGRGYDEKKISLIPNSVDPALADNGIDIPEGLQDIISRPEKIILYTGTLASWQGAHTLIDALSHLRHRSDFLLVIIASNKRNFFRLKRRISSHGLAERVIIHERLSHRGTVSLCKKAYVCVAPLARGPRNESQGCCPLKIVEAMACGTPVVASDLPAIREMIDHGIDGMLAAPDSPRALAHILDRLMGDQTMRDRLAYRAYEKARRFFMADLFSERLGAVYTSLLGGKGNAIFDR